MGERRTSPAPITLDSLIILVVAPIILLEAKRRKILEAVLVPPLEEDTAISAEQWSNLRYSVRVLFSSFAVAACTRRPVLNEPIFPLMPPFTAIRARITALTSSNHGMPLRNRLYVAFRTLQPLCMQWLYTLLFFLDDLIFSGHRSVKIEDPVFIVGGFRTGSTSLHRVLALDEERYCSPRFLELAMPFLSFHYFLDFLGWLDNRAGTFFLLSIEKALQGAAGPDVMARHPMALVVAEECDVLLSTAHWCGYYAITLFPFTKSWEAFGDISSFTAAEKAHVMALYKRTVQKVLYRRGRPGQTLLSKSHLVDCCPLWRTAFPGAKFVNIIRHPKEVVPSWVALAQPAATMLTGWQTPQLPTAVDAHLAFWDRFFEKEYAFFKTGRFLQGSREKGVEGDLKNKTGGRTTEEEEKRGDRIVLQFRPFIKQQLTTMRDVYEGWGWPFDGTPFLHRLLAVQEANKGYKGGGHGYKNPTLEELGISETIINERFATYILNMGL